MEFFKIIPLKHLVKLVCKTCLPTLIALLQTRKGEFEPCEKCKQKCIDWITIRNAADNAWEGKS
jgi:hypothetical protein